MRDKFTDIRLYHVKMGYRAVAPDGVTVLVDEKLGEIPFDGSASENAWKVMGEVLEEWVGLVAI